MFIELTDHLICPDDHEERFLVLLPGEMAGRRVVSGDLGCPVCRRVVRVMDGVADFGPAPAASAAVPDGLTGEAVAALLGLSGPGGFVALAGSVTTIASDLSRRMPGVSLVLINPPPGTQDAVEASVLRSPRLPLKTGSMRGVVLGADFATRMEWVAAAERAVLPGLRVVSEGGDPSPGLELLARNASGWVGRKLADSRRPRSEF